MFEGNGTVESILGSYSSYRENQAALSKAARESSSKNSNEASSKPNLSPTRKKLRYKEKQEYQTIENEIESLEEEKAQLNKLLGQSQSDYALLQETTARLAQVLTLIDAKTLRWMELDERI